MTFKSNSAFFTSDPFFFFVLNVEWVGWWFPSQEHYDTILNV